jgi:hypothetical protein
MEIIKFRSQLFIALEQATVRLHQAQNAPARLRTNLTNKARGLGEVVGAQASELRQWLGGGLDAMLVA